MAYSIVLNITGNATRKANALALSLERANIASSNLANNLRSISMMAGNFKPMDLRGGGGTGTPNRRSYEPREPRVPSEPHYSRHRATNILSYGSGFQFGPFSGRLSHIVQPDAQGNIMGMNAESLMRGVNITGIVGTLLKKAGMLAFKVVAGATVAPIAVGGLALTGAIRALQSESFAEGVRLIARRDQAKLGLGVQYERAQSMADFLSKSYGFDRSTTLGSINTMTGMGIGGGSRKLNMSEAAGLTKVGGLISQQSGVSFERVMTNIQQLMVQASPNIRDIREMLNQAPILGKYAMKDMEEQGIKGVDVRTWLKDQSHILSALKRYEMDLSSNAGMQARGDIALATQDFWAKIASNNKFWRMIGTSGAGVIGSAGIGVDKLMTTLANSDSFKVMIGYLETIFDKLGTKGATFIDKLIDLIDRVSQRFGLGGSKAEARTKMGRSNAIDAIFQDSAFRTDVLKNANAAGAFKDLTGEALSKKQTLFLDRAAEELKRNPEYLKTIEGKNYLNRKYSLADTWITNNPGVNLATQWMANYDVKGRNREAFFNAVGNPVSDSTYRYLATKDLNKAYTGDLVSPINAYAAYDVNKNTTMDYLKEYIKKQTDEGTIPEDLKKGTEQGSELTGFNKDRKALEIHFHAPIVEWTNTMETTSPQETVDAVAENLEELAAAAIQKALLSASNKMSTRWY